MERGGVAARVIFGGARPGIGLVAATDMGLKTSLDTAALRRLLAAIGLLLTCAGEASALTFDLRRPHEPIAVFGNAWTIFASGEIADGDATRLQRLIDANTIPDASFVYLNSPGGSLVEGLKLGQVIRQNGLYAYVGRRNGNEIISSAGECFSACALAFLGGKFRWIVEGSTYGVHRFYSGNDKTALDADTTQMMSSVIVGYIQRMGVDQQLFEEMSFTSSEAINVMTPARMRELHVINDGQGPTIWTLESGAGTIYLKGERDTFRGINKFMIVCLPNKALALYTVFDAQNRDRELSNMTAISMFLNDRSIPMSGRLAGRPEIVNGWMNAMFTVDAPLLRQVRDSQTVGVAFQYAYEAPTFFGFTGLSMDGAREKLDGILQLCGK